MQKKGCFAYKSKDYCTALITMDCTNCRFYKTKEQYKKEIKNEKIRNKEKWH